MSIWTTACHGLVLATAILLLSPATALADETETSEDTRVAEAPPAPRAPPAPPAATDPSPTTDIAEASDPVAADDSGDSRVGLSAGIDWGSQYWFRGIVQETKELIMQPWAEVGISLYSGDGAVSGVGLSVGLWNSFHTGPTRVASTATVRGWYESDFYAGVAMSLFGQLSVGLSYTAYMSPSAVFGTTHELALGTGWDDSGMYGVSWFGGLQPSFTLAFELEGGADGGPNEGIYAGIGLEPTFPVYSGSATSFSVSVPMELGLSVLDYYEGANGDTAFGFFSAGVAMAIGLGFVPEGFGAWEVGLGLQAIALGENTKTDDDLELIVSGGFSASFD